MDQPVYGEGRVELYQKVLAAKVCDECGQTASWDATDCACGAALIDEAIVKEDRGLVAFSERNDV